MSADSRPKNKISFIINNKMTGNEKGDFFNEEIFTGICNRITDMRSNQA